MLLTPFIDAVDIRHVTRCPPPPLPDLQRMAAVRETRMMLRMPSSRPCAVTKRAIKFTATAPRRWKILLAAQVGVWVCVCMCVCEARLRFYFVGSNEWWVREVWSPIQTSVYPCWDCVAVAA
jgi:hypothetical protein